MVPEVYGHTLVSARLIYGYRLADTPVSLSKLRFEVTFDAEVSISTSAGRMLADVISPSELALQTDDSDSFSLGDGGDEIDAGSGDDTVFGFAGDDSLAGGGGADRFIGGTARGDDVIRDFEVDSDEIIFTFGPNGPARTETIEDFVTSESGATTLALGQVSVRLRGVSFSEIDDIAFTILQDEGSL